MARTVSFSRFVNEDAKRRAANDEIGELMTDNAVNDAMRMSDRLIQLRRRLRQLLTLGDSDDAAWSRYFSDDVSLKRKELAVTQRVLKARRASFRFLQLRREIQDLLELDDELDEQWLETFRVTKWDRPATTEDTDATQTDAQREVATAKRQEVTAKRRVLQAKQADLAAKQRKVQRDTAKTGGTR